MFHLVTRSNRESIAVNKGEEECRVPNITVPGNSNG